MRSEVKLILLGDAAHVNVQRWCQGLTKAGAEVHVLTFAGHVPQAAATHRLPAVPRLAKLRYFMTIPYVRRLIRTIRPEVVAAYYVTGYGTLAAWSGFHPLVQVTSGSDILLAPQHPILRHIVKFNLSRADLVTAWAPHMAQAARQVGVSDDRLFVLPRGIPARDFTSHHCPSPSKDETIRLICTRTLKLSYHIDILIYAVQILKERGISSSLTLAGSGPLREELLALTRQLGIEQQVFFAGFVSNEHLPALLAEHNVYISPVKSDGVSASLLEAMAVGLLPIVPDHPANQLWIKSGDNGLLLGDPSPKDVAQAVMQALVDVELRQRAWRENPDRVRARADFDHNSQVFVERFQQLVRKKSDAQQQRLI